MHRNSTLAIPVILILAGLVGLAAGTPHEPESKPQPTDNLQPATGRFLVASRSLSDPHFARTVVYLLQHDEQGSVGLVINRVLGVTLGEALPGTRLKHLAGNRLSYGGPVSARHIIMLLRDASAAWQATPILDDIYASNNMGLLQKLDAANTPPEALRLFIGHAGWGAGQLQQELNRDDWFVVPGDTGRVFGTGTARLWERLIEQLDPVGIYVLGPANDTPPAGL
jgi:putative transcriptional regulator